MKESFVGNKRNKANNEELKVSVLGTVFERYATDTITNEQISRVLGPILRMIKNGEFDKKKILTLLPQIVVSMAALLVLVVTVLFTGPKKVSASIIIPESITPLANISNYSNNISGRVLLSGKGLKDIDCQLVDISNENVITFKTDYEGYFSFISFPDGIYSIKVLLPEGMKIDNIGENGYIEIDGKEEIVFSGNERAIDIVVQVKD